MDNVLIAYVVIIGILLLVAIILCVKIYKVDQEFKGEATEMDETIKAFRDK